MSHHVTVVPHTHWDREWYKPYPIFRMQLVELLDGLLPELEANDGYRHFQLDGQLAVIDDYLEIRPEEAGGLEKLVRADRLSVGPWYTLPDEFLVSGETLVRNLRLGRQRAEALGGDMAVGYLPDMFGHVAQMPQIFAGFGFDDAVVWRGVPSAIVTPAFTWEAPDGSQVRAEYLSDGYSNGARLPRTGAELCDQLDDFLTAQGPLVGAAVLWMNGTDHQLPEGRLPDVVAEANDADRGYTFAIGSLREHLAAARAAEGDTAPPVWRGELRSGARTNLLMGVASARVDVKQAAARAERALERVAEPLAALWRPAELWPRAFFDVAWRDVIRNSAHDSICGCSADEVNEAVLHRYAEATRVAEALTERSLIRILAASGQDAVVVNPTARPRSGVVTAVVPGDVPPPHTQQLGIRPAHERSTTVPADAAVAVVLRAFTDDPKVSRLTLSPATDGSGDLVAVAHADRAPKQADPSELRAELERYATEHPDGRVHLEHLRPTATQEVLLRAEAVPGFGWRGLAPADLGAHAVRREGSGLTNGLVTVVADTADGTFAINGQPGFGRLVDDGDAGDTYNWSPPAGDLVVDRPDEVEVSVPEAGPVRGRLEIRRRYRWPERVLDDARVGRREVWVTTTVEVQAGSDLVRVAIELDNTVRDHRLRVWFPLPEPATSSEAECAFGTVHRGLVAEGGPNEAALATYPSRRFVRAGGLLVAHEGLCEYELVELTEAPAELQARAVAITLLRAVGLISNVPMTMRALPAGPHTPTPAAQVPGPHRFDLVLHVGGRDPYAVADEAFTPLLPARFPARGGLGDATVTDQALAMTGAEVTAVTRRADGRVELRVVETRGEAATVDLGGRTGERTDLQGRLLGERVEGPFTLRPHEIATVALDETAG